MSNTLATSSTVPVADDQPAAATVSSNDSASDQSNHATDVGSTPNTDEREEFVLNCRYGELQEIHDFVKKFGKDVLENIRDDNGNTILHMVCGNGHKEALNDLLAVVPPSLISTLNNHGSSALHWAALSQQLECAKMLVECQDGPGRNLLDIKDSMGRTALSAAELAGWHEGAKWFVEIMNLDDAGEELEPVESAQDIEVEIEDADGGIAKLTLSGEGLSKSNPPSSQDSSS